VYRGEFSFFFFFCLNYSLGSVGLLCVFFFKKKKTSSLFFFLLFLPFLTPQGPVRSGSTPSAPFVYIHFSSSCEQPKKLLNSSSLVCILRWKKCIQTLYFCDLSSLLCGYNTLYIVSLIPSVFEIREEKKKISPFFFCEPDDTAAVTSWHLNSARVAQTVDVDKNLDHWQPKTILYVSYSCSLGLIFILLQLKCYRILLLRYVAK
jgi:hypothetical protein